MSLATVAKIRITTLQSHQQALTAMLQKRGIVQIDAITDSNDALAGTARQELDEHIRQLDYQIAGINFALDYLTPFSETKSSRLSVTQETLQHTVNHFKHQDVVAAVQEFEKNINASQGQIDQAEQAIATITEWQWLPFEPNQTASERFGIIFCSLAASAVPQLIAACEQQAPLSSVHQDMTGGKMAKVAIIHQHTDRAVLTAKLAELDAKIIDLPSLHVSITNYLQEQRNIIEQHREKIAVTTEEIKKYTRHITDLKIVVDYLTWERDKEAIKKQLNYTDRTVTINGWVGQSQLQRLDTYCKRITDAYVIEEIEITEDDNPPVLFNNKLSQPFESVTTLYGAPLKGEPDPTPFLAPFFTLFFGMALTDAGYGIIMAVGIWAAIKIMKIPRENQKLLRVLMWGGVATFILGALTGGWFAIDLTTLPAAIGQPLQAMQLINPVENPLVIFYISLALGFLQVIAGLTIDLWWKATHNRATEGIFGSGAWLAALIGLAVYVGGMTGMIPAIVGTIGQWVLYAGIALVIFGGMRNTKNIFLKPGLGLLGLYGIVGYFSDVLSYSRLLALGLTTSIIGMVVNVIAALVFGIPFVGWLVALVVLVGGHMFNLIINALGAFIHSGRLQFIEFFPKFMEAGGELFEPFNQQARYIRVIESA